MNRKKISAALLSLTLSTTSLTIMPMTVYSRDYLSEAGWDGGGCTDEVMTVPETVEGKPSLPFFNQYSTQST